MSSVSLTLNFFIGGDFFILDKFNGGRRISVRHATLDDFEPSSPDCVDDGATVIKILNVSDFQHCTIRGKSEQKREGDDVVTKMVPFSILSF